MKTPPITSPSRPLTRGERLVTSLLSVPVSAVAFALMFPLLIGVLTLGDAPAVQESFWDIGPLWSPSVLFFVVLFDGLIVGLVGVPVLAGMGRLFGPGLVVALGAGIVTIALLGGAGMGLSTHPTWDWRMFHLCAVLGMVSAGLFWAVRRQVRQQWARASQPTDSAAPPP